MGRSMGTRQLNRFSAKTVASKNHPGLYCDGGGLYLQVTPSGSKTWIFRFRSPLTKKLRDMGLGPLHSIGLPKAREKAAAQRKALLSGLDPIGVREEGKRRAVLEAAKAITFSQCAAAYIESHRPGWRNEKHGDQWESTIQTYCEPIIGTLPVQDVDTGLVLKVLEPIWSSKAETASRLRGRIENIHHVKRDAVLAVARLSDGRGRGACPLPVLLDCRHFSTTDDTDLAHPSPAQARVCCAAGPGIAARGSRARLSGSATPPRTTTSI